MTSTPPIGFPQPSFTTAATAAPQVASSASAPQAAPPASFGCSIDTVKFGHAPCNNTNEKPEQEPAEAKEGWGSKVKKYALPTLEVAVGTAAAVAGFGGTLVSFGLASGATIPITIAGCALAAFGLYHGYRASQNKPVFGSGEEQQPTAEQQAPGAPAAEPAKTEEAAAPAADDTNNKPEGGGEQSN